MNLLDGPSLIECLDQIELLYHITFLDLSSIWIQIELLDQIMFLELIEYLEQIEHKDQIELLNQKELLNQITLFDLIEYIFGSY